jgi:hypothetical protein
MKMKKLLHKTMLSVSIIILIVGLIGCGKRKDLTGAPDSGAADNTIKQTAAQGKTHGSSAAAEENQEKRGTRIGSVILLPASPRADSRIKVKAEIHPAPDPDAGESVSYIFFRNTEISGEQEEDSIPPGTLKKGDAIFADVALIKNGIEIERKRSAIVIIANAKPEIGEVEFPKIEGPGTYSILVNAVDADEDPLTFSLDKKYGIPPGMLIDRKSGVITYSLKQAPENDVKFKVVVKDTSGSEDWRELFIKFTKTIVERSAKDQE